MKRSIISPLVYIVIALLVCLHLAPREVHGFLFWAFGLISVPEFALEMGQFCLKANFLPVAEFFLRISTVCKRMWLFLPGRYPTDVFIVSSNQLAKVLCDQQHYAEALSINTKNIALLKKRQRPNSASLGGELVFRAYILESMGDAARALPVAEEALNVLEAADNLTVACMALNNLGLAYLNFGQADRALQILKKALEMKTRLGAGKSELAYAYNNVGCTLLLRDKFAEAEPFLRQAMLLSQFLSAEVKAATCNNLGESLQAQGKLDEAEELLEKSLGIRRRSLPNTHPHLGYSYHNLGKVMVDRGKFDAAEDFLKKALDIRMKSPGVRNREFNETAREYCKLLKRLGRDNEADALIETHRLKPDAMMHGSKDPPG